MAPAGPELYNCVARLMRIRSHYRVLIGLLTLTFAVTTTAAADAVKPPETPASSPAAEMEANGQELDLPLETEDAVPDPAKADAQPHPRVEDSPEVGFLEFYGISDTVIWIIFIAPICLGAVGFYLIRRRVTAHGKRRRRRVVV